jgi:hypothetical protein
MKIAFRIVMTKTAALVGIATVRSGNRKFLETAITQRDGPK